MLSPSQALIEDALVVSAIALCEQEQLLPKLSALPEQLERCTSLSRAQSQPAAKALVGLFEDSKFEVRVVVNI